MLRFFGFGFITTHMNPKTLNSLTETPGQNALDKQTTYKLLFDGSQKSLADQRKSVAEIRQRTGIMLSASGIVTAFFISTAFSSGSKIGWSNPVLWLIFLAIILTILCFLVFALILWVHQGWWFGFSTEDFVSDYLADCQTVSLSEIYYRLALRAAKAEKSNSQKLHTLYNRFKIGIILFMTQNVVWSIVLIVKII